jgi:hypothetical protein
LIIFHLKIHKTFSQVEKFIQQSNQYTLHKIHPLAINWNKRRRRKVLIDLLREKKSAG